MSEQAEEFLDRNNIPKKAWTLTVPFNEQIDISWLLEQFSQESQWISVDDWERLPESGHDNEVDIYCKREYDEDPTVITGWLESYGWCSRYAREDENITVFKWRPRPLPPKNKQQ